MVAETLAQSQGLWHLRESIPLAQSEEGLNIKHDISLPVSAIPDFVAHTDAALQARYPGVRLVNFGHLGDGNLHYNVQAPAGADGARFLAEHEHAVNTVVFDVVARSMTEGDRNAKLMTSALLSRADPAFLDGVIDEAFDPELAGVYRPDELNAAPRRLEDAAFRGHLIRAAVRGTHRRLAAASEDEAATMAEAALPTLHRIMQDAELRVPEVLRLGASREAVDGALDEQVEGYLAQVGWAMRLYARLARAQGETGRMHDDLRQLLRRVQWSRLGESRFASAQTSAVQQLLFELALAPGLRDGLDTDWATTDTTPEAALAQGLAALREALGEDGIEWDALGKQVGA